MSSAILYAAIVAIWACVLVPRWLRLRSAPLRQAQPVPPEDLRADTGQAGAPGGQAPATAGQAPALAEEPAVIPGRAVTPGLAVTPSPTVTPGPAVTPGSAAPEPSCEPDVARDGFPGAPARAGHAGRREQPTPSAAPAPAEHRARVLRARRRLLATLGLLTAGAVGMALFHLVPGWLIIPPALMLAGLLVLLREAAHSDAQRARQRTLADRRDPERTAGPDVAGEGRPAHRTSGQPAPSQTPAAAGAQGGAAAPAGAFPETTAEIIDISARISDQLYDQYSDAADRAVGD